MNAEGMPDIAEADFDTLVVQASHDRPVVVDFWAPWCGPCHHLSPLLEQVAQRHAGDVDAVKLNVDQAPDVARRYRIQGIPAVKAFKDGKVAGEFVGVQSEAVIEQLFAAVVPTQADRLVAQALAAADDAERERLLRRGLAEQRDHPRGVAALAQLLIARDDDAEAVSLLERLPHDPDARRLLASVRFGDVGDDDIKRLRADADAGDAKAALRLGQVLAARGDYAGALPRLIDAAREPATRDDARTSVLTVFEALGPDDDLVRTWRPRLAAALF